jgi:hypothetical protein
VGITSLHRVGLAIAAGCVWAVGGANAQVVSATSLQQDVSEIAVNAKRQQIGMAGKRPSMNYFGLPGLLDMPSGEMARDGQFMVGISTFAKQTRYSSYFQVAPWLGFGFRYAGVSNTEDNELSGYDPYYDRGFDLNLRIADEGRLRPHIALGLRDFAGTGIYSSEYLVATKNIDLGQRIGQSAGSVKVSLGLGWGRLGSYNSIGATGIRHDTLTDRGGSLEYSNWFRGDVAPFGGIEWHPTPRTGIKLEYSSDIYRRETINGTAFSRRSPINLAAEYQLSRATRVGVSYMYGDAIGAHLQMQFNPKDPLTPLAVMPAPSPIKRRPDPAQNAAAYDMAWTQSREITGDLHARLDRDLRANGIVMEGLSVQPNVVTLRIRNLRYASEANAIGRAARVLAALTPAAVETFQIVPVRNGVAVSMVEIPRQALETLEYEPGSADKLLAASWITTGADAGQEGTDLGGAPGLYPGFSWGIMPYFQPMYFDPVVPLRMDAGLALTAAYHPAPGWVTAGRVNYRLGGNVANGRLSNSVLPHVRSDHVLYAQNDLTMPELYGAHYTKLTKDIYARATVGYLESMYGGLSGEVLWKPVGSWLGLGIEANFVQQRNYDQRFGFQDYRVFTGHGSAYAEFGGGYTAQINAGRYLAGDTGATFSFDREFDNGWIVGGFFTLTNVSAEDFGEGSFDKGVRIRIPLNWGIGRPTRSAAGTTIRIIQRDGGQMVKVPGRLYRAIREGHNAALSDQWARVWQ